MNSVLRVIEAQHDVFVVDNRNSRLSDEIDHFKVIESSVFDLRLMLI